MTASMSGTIIINILIKQPSWHWIAKFMDAFGHGCHHLSWGQSRWCLVVLTHHFEENKHFGVFFVSVFAKKNLCFQSVCWIVTTHKPVACPKAPKPIWAQNKQSKFNRTSESPASSCGEWLWGTKTSVPYVRCSPHLAWELIVWGVWAPTAATDSSHMFSIGRLPVC